jgi:sulfur carrier protein
MWPATPTPRGSLASRPGYEAVRVTVNGDHHELPDGATVATVIELLQGGAGGRGVAVAVGGEVVARGAWQTTALSDGERVEIVVAVQGG